MDSIQRIYFPEPFSVEHETVPAPSEPLGANQLDFKTRFSLISPGTELAFYMGTHVGIPDPANSFAKYPFYPGYAGIGTVTAVGAEVTNVAVGDRIYGIVRHASRARLTWDEWWPWLKVPDSCAPEDAPFTRLAAIAATAAAVAPPRDGEKVLVLGGGMIGNLGAQVYAMRGARVAIVEPVEERRVMAADCGLTPFDSAAEAREWLEADPDIVVEATGVPQLTNTALEIVRRRGQVVLLGSPRGTVEMQIYQHIHAKGVRLSGAHEALLGTDGLPGRLELSREMMAGIGDGRIKVRPLLTDILPASEARKAYEMLRNQQALGVLLDWQ